MTTLPSLLELELQQAKAELMVERQFRVCDQKLIREIKCCLFEILNPNLDREQAIGDVIQLLKDVAKYVGGLEEEIDKLRNKTNNTTNNNIITAIKNSTVEEEIQGHKYTHYVYNQDVAEALIELAKKVQRLERNNVY